MTTIDSPSIIQTLLSNDGKYPGDPKPYSIFSYTNAFGRQTYSVNYNLAGHESFLSSPYILSPVLLWDRNGIKPAGTKFLGLGD
jgi:hypothetical protein